MLWGRAIGEFRRRRYRRIVAGVREHEATLLAATNDELRTRCRGLKFAVADGGHGDRPLVEAFALMSEACRRTIGLRPYDVQLFAGAALCEHMVAEMQTGEGKTLTAAFPLFYQALFGEGSLLATGNDYLAERDAAHLGPAFRLLGVSVGFVVERMAPDERRPAYACDVTYGTGKEFGFDFLRDEMSAAASEGAASRLQRPPFAMLVDEADQVLIDDASTPLIISMPSRKASNVTAERFKWAAAQVDRLQPEIDFVLEERKLAMRLTAAGRKHVRDLPQPRELQSLGWNYLYEDVERALLARRIYRPGVHYVVHDEKVQIVDEFTGRIAEGRQWSRGLHQAVEAQENVPITDGDGQAARITVQEFFSRFPRLAGMTGTVATAAREFATVYEMPTMIVPTHRPSRRGRLPTRIFRDAAAKRRAVCDAVRALQASGRPVLVGTRSIGASERLSQDLREMGVVHDVLNAREIAREAAIVAGAGERGRVTVATNMAGRGTDIKLGSGVAELGGLHVMLTELHEAPRIDRQLVGRGARQGDPGSYQTFLAVDDDLLREAFGKSYAERIVRRAADKSPELSRHWERLFLRAQRKVENRRFRRRTQFHYYERERTKSAQETGLNAYLDLPG